MTAARLQPAGSERRPVRALGFLAALVSGPLWATGITWTVVRVNGVAAGDVDADGRVAYSLFWFALVCLLFFAATVGYALARRSLVPVRWALIALQGALVTVATLTVSVSLLR